MSATQRIKSLFGSDNYSTVLEYMRHVRMHQMALCQQEKGFMESMKFAVLSGNVLESSYTSADGRLIRCTLKPELLLGRIGGLSGIGFRWSAQKTGDDRILQGLSKTAEEAITSLTAALENWSAS